MDETKSVYRFKAKSKRVILAIVLVFISAVIRLIFSNVGLYVSWGWAQNFVVIMEFLYASTIITTYKQKIPFAWLGGALIIWALLHYVFRLQFDLIVEFLLLITGIFLILMSYGFLKTKAFAIMSSALSIVMSFVNFFDTFRRFFLVDFFHDDIFPSTEQIMNFSIIEVRYIGCLLIAIATLLCVSAVQLQTVTIAKRSKEIVQIQSNIPQGHNSSTKKYCAYCGKEIMSQAVICPHCGCQVSATIEMDTPSKGLNILSFFIPLVGLILYCVNIDKTPTKAKAIGKWALIGFGVGLGGSLLLYALLMIIMSL